MSATTELYQSTARSRPFGVITANMAKIQDSNHILLNDPSLHYIGALLLQEINCRRSTEGDVITSPGSSASWTLFTPSISFENRRWPIRSCMYVNSSIKAVQVNVASPDITSVRVRVGTRVILLCSVYIPCYRNSEDEPQRDHLPSRLAALRTTIQRERLNYPELEFIIAGDFNKHDTMWGGDKVVGSPRQGEAADLIDFMDDFNLTSILERGTITFRNPRGDESTLDLVLTSPELVNEIQHCRVRDNAHGSDHEPIEALFTLQYEERLQQPKLLFRFAPWDKIKAMVQELLPVTPYDLTSVESCAARIINAVDFAIRTHCPVSKPSPYSKKWWTADLTIMRKAYVFKRNAARSSRRAGLRDYVLEQAVTAAGKAFYAAARRQKRAHWNDFLAEEVNIWKAAKYLQPEARSGFAKIPALQTSDGITTEDDKITVQLIKDFFPPLPQRVQQDDSQQQTQQLPMEPISEQDIYNALLRAKKDKAPGLDGKPTRVWIELWPILRNDLLHLFQISIEQGRLASTWKVVKIVPLRKNRRADYIVLKVYRPISLLLTLGKLLESIIVERILYLAKTYRLLLKYYFRAKK